MVNTVERDGEDAAIYKVDRRANGWNEWAKKVLSDSEWTMEQIEGITLKLNTISVEIAILKTELAHIAKTEGEEAGRKWGIITGVATGLIVGLIMVLINHIVK